MLWLIVYVVMAMIVWIVAASLLIQNSKLTNIYYNGWGEAQDTMTGMFIGLFWPISVVFYSAKLISNRISDWLIKQSKEQQDNVS